MITSLCRFSTQLLTTRFRSTLSEDIHRIVGKSNDDIQKIIDGIRAIDQDGKDMRMIVSKVMKASRNSWMEYEQFGKSFVKIKRQAFEGHGVVIQTELSCSAN